MSYYLNDENTIIIKEQQEDTTYSCSYSENIIDDSELIVGLTNREVDFITVISLKNLFNLKKKARKIIKNNCSDFEELKKNTVYAETMITEYFHTKNKNIKICSYCNSVHDIDKNSEETTTMLVISETSQPIRSIKIHEDCLEDFIDDINNIPQKFKTYTLPNFLVD